MRVRSRAKIQAEISSERAGLACGVGRFLEASEQNLWTNMDELRTKLHDVLRTPPGVRHAGAGSGMANMAEVASLPGPFCFTARGALLFDL